MKALKKYLEDNEHIAHVFFNEKGEWLFHEKPGFNRSATRQEVLEADLDDDLENSKPIAELETKPFDFSAIKAELKNELKSELLEELKSQIKDEVLFELAEEAEKQAKADAETKVLAELAAAKDAEDVKLKAEEAEKQKQSKPTK